MDAHLSRGRLLKLSETAARNFRIRRWMQDSRTDAAKVQIAHIHLRMKTFLSSVRVSGMGVALIVTLGFDEKFCYRAVLRHGISDGDAIYLITAGNDERVMKAYEAIRSFVSTSFRNISVELIKVPTDFVQGVKLLVDRFRRIDSPMIVNLSGGMRILALMTFAALAISGREAEVEVELEDFSGVVSIPRQLIAMLAAAKIGEEKRELLRTLVGREMEAREIAERLGKDVTTVRRHVRALSELGLVKVVKRKPLTVTATELAELV